MILMGMARYSQSSQNDTLAMSLQYLKKEVRNGVHFLHADKHQSFYKLALSFLIKVVRHVQGTQKRKLVIFLLYIKKKVSQLLLCSILMQIIQIFYGGQVMFVETWHWQFYNHWLFSENVYCKKNLANWFPEHRYFFPV